MNKFKMKVKELLKNVKNKQIQQIFKMKIKLINQMMNYNQKQLIFQMKIIFQKNNQGNSQLIKLNMKIKLGKGIDKKLIFQGRKMKNLQINCNKSKMFRLIQFNIFKYLNINNNKMIFFQTKKQKYDKLIDFRN
ncbi:hypothetical protein IMG5_166360 [Ichthyophthirius multifiliis]|uniref:Uncharacterized protein n=1 Tax=Ichthyophthirius multifiliis TaxID=5932 RepID=G0R0R0_ICHMU|nr:hypothetical protein IMG5_166360 [Ichthyophthirius multifiliis]EGR28944.1 hypothetical protein IMG5_166360 [Ichthyophthirius multifiliis]|eukprot:XP_004030180.1 hypothetical protein IMG5_166360 [Ichthyophthirius multifiliis]